jgi:hypothetical protein
MILYDFREDHVKIGGVDDISVFQLEIWVMKEMIDSLCIDVGRSSNKTVDDVFLLEKEFSEIGTILTTNPCNKSNIHF